MEANTYRLEVKNISKEFPGVRALDNVSLRVRPGTVHALVGENGAGKSTLIKIINGLYTADSGEILLDGKKVTIKTPMHACELGISTIHQELSYVPDFTLEENMFLGREIKKTGNVFLNKKKMSAITKDLLSKEGLNYSPKTKIKSLGFADLQFLEIIKAVSYNANLVIMDEPTSALTTNEVEALFKKIEELKLKGISVIYISHRLEEIFRIADEVTVLRDGKVVHNAPASELNVDKLISHMVGRDFGNQYPGKKRNIGEVVLETKNISGANGKFKDVNIQVRKGEVVGLAGLMGAGRTEVMRALFGMDKLESGVVLVNGKEIKVKNVGDAIRKGIALVSEDRKREGIIPELSVSDNIALPSIRNFKVKGLINSKKISAASTEMVGKFRIKTPSLKTKIASLSGGNQQKIILSKWMLTEPIIFLLDEPTLGIDVGAKQEMFKHIAELAEEGMAVLMASSELDEIVGMCNRVYVMHEGSISGELQEDEIERNSILKYAFGG